jgi:hypothetical protein
MLGANSHILLAQVDRARRARNAVMYEGGIETVSGVDAEDFIGVVARLDSVVTSWLEERHPDLLTLL